MINKIYSFKETQKLQLFAAFFIPIMKNILLILFALATLADLYFIHFGYPFRMISKPLIMLSLIAYFLISTTKLALVRTFNAKLFLAALIAALFGDIFLLSDRTLFFILGIVSFLIMQVMYAYLFAKQKNASSIPTGLVLGGLLLYAILFNSYTWSRVGDLKIAVGCYTLAIMAMVFFGLLRDRNLNGYMLVAIGVLLFMISDSCLALGKFAGGFPHVGLVVMGTYALAQYCIVRGYLADQ